MTTPQHTLYRFYSARTAHLNGKRWIDFTDWFDLIARIAAVEA